MHDDGLDETYQYADALGRMSQHLRTMGSSTLTESWEYSGTGSGSKIVAHQQLTNGTPASHDVTTTFDPNGWPLTVTDTVDGASVRNEFHYDARGRVTSEKRAVGSVRERTTTFTYDDA